MEQFSLRPNARFSWGQVAFYTIFNTLPIISPHFLKLNLWLDKRPRLAATPAGVHGSNLRFSGFYPLCGPV